MTMTWEDYPCVDCGHPAKDHVMYKGPCSGCWREVKVICEHYRASLEAVEAIEAAAREALQ